MIRVKNTIIVHSLLVIAVFTALSAKASERQPLLGKRPQSDSAMISGEPIIVAHGCDNDGVMRKKEEKASREPVVNVKPNLMKSHKREMRIIDSVQLDWNSYLSETDKLLVDDPGTAFKNRGTFLAKDRTPITGHNGQALGWTQTPKIMTQLVRLVAGSALDAIAGDGRAYLLSVDPQGVFTDVVTVAHILRQNQKADISLTYLLGNCINHAKHDKEVSFLRTWVTSRYPTARFFIGYCRPRCISGGRCPAGCKFYTSSADRTDLSDFNVVYGCNATDKSGYATIQKVINVCSPAAVGVAYGISGGTVRLGATDNAIEWNDALSSPKSSSSSKHSVLYDASDDEDDGKKESE